MLVGDVLDVTRKLTAGSIAGLVTDPPYSSGGAFRGDRARDTAAKYSRAGVPLPSFAGDSRDQRAYLTWCSLWLAEALRASEDGVVVAVFADWRMLPTVTDAIQCGGWTWRGVAPWHKPGARPQMGRFASECEYVVWGSKGAMPTERGVGCLPGFFEGRSPAAGEREHQTQKPLGVMREVVRLVRPGGVVLDPFAGSGTTGVACALEGRAFLGVELSEHYAAVARRRIAAACGAP